MPNFLIWALLSSYVCSSYGSRVLHVNLQPELAGLATSAEFFRLLETVNPKARPELQKIQGVVDEFGKLKDLLQCQSEDNCAQDQVDPVVIASAILRYASMVCKVLPPPLQAAVPILDALNKILISSKAADPPMTLESLSLLLTERIDKSVREMQTFHVERDIADARVQAIMLDDVRAEISERVCSDELLREVYRADEGANKAMVRLLARAEPLNRAPLIQQAVDGTVKDANELLDLLLLGGTYYKAWHVVANSRFQLLVAAISKYRSCADGARTNTSTFQDLEVHLNITLLQRSAARFQTSDARQGWVERSGVIADHLLSMFSDEVTSTEGSSWRRSEECDRSKYEAWTSVQTSIRANHTTVDPKTAKLLILAKYLPEKCIDVLTASYSLARKCSARGVSGFDLYLYRAQYYMRLREVCGGALPSGSDQIAESLELDFTKLGITVVKGTWM